MPNTAIQDRVVSTVLLVLIGAGYAATFDFEAVAFYPRLLLGLMAALALAIGARSLLSAPTADNSPDEAVLTPARLLQPVAITALIVAYAWAVPVTGYFAATVVALPIMVIYMGVRSLLLPLACGLGFAAFVYGLFRLQLGVPLPSGALF